MLNRADLVEPQVFASVQAVLDDCPDLEGLVKAAADDLVSPPEIATPSAEDGLPFLVADLFAEITRR